MKEYQENIYKKLLMEKSKAANKKKLKSQTESRKISES